MDCTFFSSTRFPSPPSDHGTTVVSASRELTGQPKSQHLNGRRVSTKNTPSDRLIPTINEANLFRPTLSPSRILEKPYQKAIENKVFPSSRQVLDYGSHPKPKKGPQLWSPPLSTAKNWSWDKKEKDILQAPGYGNDFYRNNMDWGHERIGLTVSLQDYYSGASGVYARVHSLVEKSLRFEVRTDCERLVPEDGSFYSDLTWGRNPGSNLYLASRSSNSVKVYDISKREVSSDLPLGAQPQSISACRSSLAVGAMSSTLLIDLRAGKIQERLAEGMQNRVCGVRLSSDEQHLVAGDDSNTFRWWDLRTLRSPLIEHKFRSAVKAMAFSPFEADLHVAVGTGLNDKRLALFSKNSTTPRILAENIGQVSGLIWTESGAVVASDRFGRRMIAFDALSGSLIGQLQLPAYPLAVVKHRSGPEFSVACSDEMVRTFELPGLKGQRSSSDKAKPNETRFTTIR